MLRDLAYAALDIFMPRHCPVSGRPLLPDERGPVAPEVLRAVQVAGRDYCKRCGAPQGEGVGQVGECQSCRDARDGFGTREIAAVGNYAEPLRSMCKAMKLGGCRDIGAPLAAWLVQLLVDRGISDEVDAVVAVPLHALRRYERGYNQAELIARPVAQALAKPLVAGALKRTRGTDRQARLSALERRKNVEDAFEVRARGSEAIKGKKLLLVDDVMTTGATFGAAARALKKSGARAVYGAIAARAALGDDG
jgi:ComF family protein